MGGTSKGVIQIIDRLNAEIGRCVERDGAVSQNMADAYNRFIGELLPIVSDEDCTLDDILQICRCDYSVSPSLWDTVRDTKVLFRFLAAFSGKMIFLGRPDMDMEKDDIEPFCHAGEILCGTLEQPENWLHFQKLRVSLLIRNQCITEAEAALAELEEIIPQDEYISEAKNLVEEAKYFRGIAPEDITDFYGYMKWLRANRDRYVFLIASFDTLWGPSMSEEKAEIFRQSLGLRFNVYGEYRCSYVAAIDKGMLITERLFPRGQAAIWEGMIGDSAVKLESHGFEAEPLTVLIMIDGVHREMKVRGINIVTYEKENRKVIDNVTFDTYSENQMQALHANSFARELSKWHREYPEVGLICYNTPSFPEENLSSAEQRLLDHKIFWMDLMEDDALSWSPLIDYADGKEDIREALTAPLSYHDAFGVRHFEDKRGKCVNTVAGHRLTTDQPESPRRTIYFVGGCVTYGVGVSDRYTVESCLQRLCNERAGDQRLIVQNYGYFLGDIDKRYNEEITILRSLPVKAGDVVLCNFGYSKELPFLDVSGLGARPHDKGELFFDYAGHLTPVGYQLEAEAIFEFLEQHRFFAELIPKEPAAEQNVSVPDAETEALRDYKDMLRGLYRGCLPVGAIVMHCNPFTLGHRYLVEQAAKQCAHLVIFVVEEDKAEFKFEERMDMVKTGVADLQNVTVTASGRYVLSSLTFSEYFNKSKLQDRVIDSSMDVRIFAGEIAPCLHISKRFVGTEPFDKVTLQYNNDMKAILPQYGIEVVEIRRLVPDTTYEFVAGHFRDIRSRM